MGIQNFLFFQMVLKTLLALSGTVEMYPGPLDPKKNNLSFAVWNLENLPSLNYASVPLIETFQATNNFVVFRVCESFLSEAITNNNIHLNGFSSDPFWADKRNNVQNGGVCLHFKENLLIKERCDLEMLPETIVAEVKLNRMKIFIIQSYYHPNLPSGDFDAYIKGLENIYNRVRNENPLLVVLTGDFNAKSLLLLEHVRGVHSVIFCYQII